MLEGLEWRETLEGTPQGAGISPLRANIFLHDALALWVQHWRRTPGRGRVIIVRYADDFVMGVQRETEAREMLVALRERLGTVTLALHGDKTRLIEFGKLVAGHRRARNTRRPWTFSFLGFTHDCAWSLDGRFVVKRWTEGRRVSRKLQEVQAELRRRMPTPTHAQPRWLCSVLARARCLIRTAEQLATLGLFSRRGEAPLVPSAVPAESAPLDMGAIQRVAGTLPIAFDPYHSPARGVLGPRWVTFGSRVRESRTLGSVGAKAEWLSYPTTAAYAPEAHLRETLLRHHQGSHRDVGRNGLSPASRSGCGKRHGPAAELEQPIVLTETVPPLVLQGRRVRRSCAD